LTAIIRAQILGIRGGENRTKSRKKGRERKENEPELNVRKRRGMERTTRWDDLKISEKSTRTKKQGITSVGDRVIKDQRKKKNETIRTRAERGATRGGGGVGGRDEEAGRRKTRGVQS